MAGRTRTAAEEDLDDLLQRQPELKAYMYPASAGDMDALGKKLDGIIDLLQRIANEQARIADVTDRPRAACAERVPFPEPGQVEVEHIPGVYTTIRATLLPGMALTLPPMPSEDGGRETHRKLGRLLTGQRKLLGAMKRSGPNRDIADAVHRAALDDLLDALELVAQRPDVIAVMREREVAGENHVRKVFGELPVAPSDGPLTHLILKAGLPQ